MAQQTFLYDNQMYPSKLWAHLLLDLSIGCLYNYLLPGSSGGSGVLLHRLLLTRSSLETKERRTVVVNVRFITTSSSFKWGPQPYWLSWTKQYCWSLQSSPNVTVATSLLTLFKPYLNRTQRPFFISAYHVMLQYAKSQIKMWYV